MPDALTPEALAIEAGQRLEGEDVVETFDRVMSARAAPEFLFMNGGTDF